MQPAPSLPMPLTTQPGVDWLGCVLMGAAVLGGILLLSAFFFRAEPAWVVRGPLLVLGAFFLGAAAQAWLSDMDWVAWPFGAQLSAHEAAGMRLAAGVSLVVIGALYTHRVFDRIRRFLTHRAGDSNGKDEG